MRLADPAQLDPAWNHKYYNISDRSLNIPNLLIYLFRRPTWSVDSETCVTDMCDRDKHDLTEDGRCVIQDVQLRERCGHWALWSLLRT